MQSSYRSLKDIVTYINTDTDRKSIDSLSVVFDTETGLLASTMAFNAYSLTGTEKEYAAPQVSGVFYGTSDIFNTGEKSAAIAAEKMQKIMEIQTKHLIKSLTNRLINTSPRM